LLFSKIKVDNFDFKKKCEEIATKTEGFSGRELSKLLVACQASTYASDDGTFTEKMFETKLELALDAHKKKMQWKSEHEN
jgi:ATPase family AAA domain-containing protein 3A/B